MTIKKLFTMLVHAQSCKVQNWGGVLDILDVIADVTVLNKEWVNSKKNVADSHPDMYPLDLTKRETWSTYSDCVDLKFYINDNILYCDAKIYDGDLGDGFPTDGRFKATMIMPNSFVKTIADEIEDKFALYMEHKYKEHLDAKKKRWIDKETNKLLS